MKSKKSLALVHDYYDSIELEMWFTIFGALKSAHKESLGGIHEPIFLQSVATVMLNKEYSFQNEW